jgi:hypothetical protein
MRKGAQGEEDCGKLAKEIASFLQENDFVVGAFTHRLRAYGCNLTLPEILPTPDAGAICSFCL